MIRIRRASLPSVVVCFLAAFPSLGAPTAGSVSRAPDWKPVSPAELSLKSPVVEADADVEAIFWDVRLEDSVEVTGAPRTDTWNHVRVKVFTERGRAAFTRIDIPFEGRTRIGDLALRTIRPDGSIVEVSRDAVTERTVVKVGGIKAKTASVAVPALEVGGLVEYRWREIEPEKTTYFTHLTVERTIPVQSARYAFHPLDIGGWDMQTQTFFAQIAPFTRDRDGFSYAEVTNIHSVKDEPFMPPADTLRAWMLVHYTDQKEGATPEEYWREAGRRSADRYKALLRPGGDVKSAAAAAVGGETDPEKKLRRLFDLCRGKLVNVDAPGSAVSREEREKLAKEETPSSVLSRGKGTGVGIDLAFAALANASGLEARLALTGDRSTFFFEPRNTSRYFLRHEAIAVKVGEGWRFFSPGGSALSFGRLPWQQEEQLALVCDPKEPRFVRVPGAPVEANRATRKARFKLAEDGTLEGSVSIELDGQPAIERRVALAEAAGDAFEKEIREEVTDRIPGAEVTAITVEGRDAPERPLAIGYKVRVAGYATRAGSRLLFAPSWFRKGRPVPFPTAKRTHPVFFPYGTTQEDEVVVELPKGFIAEEIPAPAPVRLLGAKGEVKATFAQEGITFTFRRTSRFNGGTFDVVDYPSLKRGFDRIQSNDETTVALKQGP